MFLAEMPDELQKASMAGVVIAEQESLVFYTNFAENLFVAQKPDIVILDLGLPAGDGFSVLERLKVNESLSSIPVIVLSGRDRVGNWDRALKAGAKTFLQKPVANDKLLAVIRLVLAEHEHAGPTVYDLTGPAGQN